MSPATPAQRKAGTAPASSTWLKYLRRAERSRQTEQAAHATLAQHPPAQQEGQQHRIDHDLGFVVLGRFLPVEMQQAQRGYDIDKLVQPLPAPSAQVANGAIEGAQGQGR